MFHINTCHGETPLNHIHGHKAAYVTLANEL